MDLFTNPSIRRLCLTIDGGVGKTTTLRWLAAMQNRDGGFGFGGAKLTMRFDLKRATSLGVAYKALHDGGNDGDGRAEAAIMQCLIGQFRRPDPGRPIAYLTRQDDEQIEIHLRRLVRAGRLALLVDGLDQTTWLLDPDSNSGPQVNPVVGGLAYLLTHQAPGCPVVIAGRPHSVSRYWDELFDGQSWRFGQIDSFRDNDQKRAFLGDRYNAIQQLEADALEVPRMLSAARQLDIDRLKSIRATSELYIALIDHLWQQDQSLDGKLASKSRSMRLLAAIAFEMFRSGQRGGVSAAKLSEFKQDFLRNRGEMFGFSDEEEFDDALNELARTNSLLQHSFLESDREITDLYFRDTTLQEFFVGYWLVTAATDEDHTWMASFPFLRPFQRNDGDPDLGDETLYRIWRFAVETPAGPAVEQRWLNLTSLIFQPNPSVGRRSNEIMYRAYGRLTETAKRTTGSLLGASEESMFATKVLCEFHSEFSDQILTGERGSESRTVAADLLSRFRPIPLTFQDPSDLRFRSGSTKKQLEHPSVGRPFGDETPREVQLTGCFEISDIPVTVEQYRLYEHAPLTKCGQDNSPQTQVDWFGAKMYCRWLNSSFDSEKRFRLPHELQWEFAARAGTESARPFCEDNTEQDVIVQILHNYAVFEDGIANGDSAVSSRRPNRWGLYDMLGLVSEWCENPISHDPREALVSMRVVSPSAYRVCRGGSWMEDATHVRSAIRRFFHPAFTNLAVGFRVARG